MPGWKCDISGVRKWEDLPEAARNYVEYVEQDIGCHITYVSVAVPNVRVHYPSRVGARCACISRAANDPSAVQCPGRRVDFCLADSFCRTPAHPCFASGETDDPQEAPMPVPPTFSERKVDFLCPKTRYESPLASRYASEFMLHLFSPDMRFETWRRLWVALARAEHNWACPSPRSRWQELEAHITDIDYETAARGSGRSATT